MAEAGCRKSCRRGSKGYAAGRPVSFFVADSTLSTGRTYIEVSNDGLLMIGWLDAGETSNVLKIARRRLDCGGSD